MRHLGYTRVSTSSQDAKLQFDALLAAGVQKRDVFADVTSGSRIAIERPGMKKLLEYATEGDTVVVWRVDRLGRSLIDVLNTVNLLRERGILVRSLSDGIDPATSTGRLMLNMLATLAEYERELITERVNAGIAAAKQGGTRFGRPLSDPKVISDKLALVADARVKGRTAEDAARLVGWSRATLYRHQQALAISESTTTQK
jgi:DNA invertase Pin-like site-specific DNA recombinase